MKISFNMPNGTSRTSPEFSNPHQDVLEDFWDFYLGSEDEDTELFWNSDVQGSDDWIHVDWFSDPATPEETIKEISKQLQVPIPTYDKWTSENVRSWDLPEVKAGR